MNTISQAQKIKVAKKGTFEIHSVRNEIALQVIVNGICWMSTKYYSIESAPQMILKYA
jgi:hypothetical protein